MPWRFLVIFMTSNPFWFGGPVGNSLVRYPRLKTAFPSAALSYRAERMTYLWLEPVWHPSSGTLPKKLGDWDPQFVDKAQTTCLRPWYHIALQKKQPGPDGRQS